MCYKYHFSSSSSGERKIKKPVPDLISVPLLISCANLGKLPNLSGPRFSQKMKLSVGSDVLSVAPSSSEGVFPPSIGDSVEHISVR